MDPGGNLSRSKGIVGVSNPQGEFCVALAPGIDPATTVAVVTPDFGTDRTNYGTNEDQAFAEWDSGDCDDGSLQVFTGNRSESLAPAPLLSSPTST